MNVRSKILFTLVILGFTLSSCHKKIEITDSYILNKNWSLVYNVTIIRMLPVDGNPINPDLTSGRDLLFDLKEDSSFYYCFVGLPYPKEMVEKKIVYFNRAYPSSWWESRCYAWPPPDTATQKKVLGRLSSNTWYRIEDLAQHYIAFFYMDTTGRKYNYFTPDFLTNY